MDELPKISAEALRALLYERVDEVAERVIAAVNMAKPGQLIADSEEQVREIMGGLRQAVFETAMQQQGGCGGSRFSRLRKTCTVRVIRV